MNKNLLFFIISTSMFAQEYKPMSKENNSWKFQLSADPKEVDCELSQNKIDYTLSAKLTKVIEGKEYREIYRQFNFDSKESFQKAWMCDKVLFNGKFLGYLDENNYNQAILAGYIRDEDKKVFVRQLDGKEKKYFDFSEKITVNPIPYLEMLYEINEGTYYNIETREFVYKVLSMGHVSKIYEGVGFAGGTEFIYRAKDNIFGFKSYMLGFSTDGGQSYYKLNNEFLKVDKLEKSKTYKITENPVKNVLILNTVKGIQEISIIDNNGRIILQKNKNFDKLNVAQLTIGKYYLVITTNQQKETLSFLKK
ncbi:T9SS type A sorting domain-containing protein [Empedobacter brevis]|uniref:T9SS type A sorting domain-containing protein n=1 Tax=Empedobacter brevis TaxID=247 RepID=UPI0023F378C5|nr:T9SS type A sorting domain-containing protein [Empedobacter brevis]